MRYGLISRFQHQGGRSGAPRRVGRRGTAAAELALLLPFLFFIFLITVDFTRVFYYSMTVDNCACNGALFGSQVFNGGQWQEAGAQIASIEDATVADGTSLNPPWPQATSTSRRGTTRTATPWSS